MALVTVDKEKGEDFRSKDRWSANKKLDVVLRLLRGEKLEELSREVGVEAHRLAAWRDEFLDAGREGLKGKRATTEDDRRLRDAERKIGELTLENEVWKKVAEKRGLQVGFCDRDTTSRSHSGPISPASLGGGPEAGGSAVIVQIV
jgi:transposase-like protein